MCSDPINKQALKTAKENFCWEFDKAQTEWLELKCGKLNHLNGRNFGRPRGSFSEVHLSPDSVFCMIKVRLCRILQKKFIFFSVTFFSGQHLRSEEFNEQFQKDVTDQINVISMYEQANDCFLEITGYELERADLRREIYRPR